MRAKRGCLFAIRLEQKLPNGHFLIEQADLRHNHDPDPDFQMENIESVATAQLPHVIKEFIHKADMRCKEAVKKEIKSLSLKHLKIILFILGVL